jgi:hypothetical protein
MSDSVPNTKHCAVPIAVPRDPAEYRATTHFGQRAHERLPDPDKRDRVIRECIESGQCYGTTDIEHADDHNVLQYFAFQTTLFDAEWRVIVGMRKVAFMQPDKQHLAVTVMEVTE